MNQSLILLIAALIVAGQPASAEEIQPSQMTIEEKEQIAWAIQVLAKSKTLHRDINGTVSLDRNILEDLKNIGLLKNDRSKASTICVGPAKD